MVELPCHLSTAQPKAIVNISSNAMDMPAQRVSVQEMDIPTIKVMSAARLEYILDQIPENNLPYPGSVLTGSGHQAPFTTLHDYQVRYINFHKSGELEIPKGRYLKVTLEGSVDELAEAIEFLYFSYLPQSNFYSVPGYEWMCDIEETEKQQWRLSCCSLSPKDKRDTCVLASCIKAQLHHAPVIHQPDLLSRCLR
ncbi:GyrI-like domain-containing protein [Vibrio mexicanus]|uniref:GyrI-like domain-containing protein n=1 Tax=Vibrio mexicanus TaxID=1004326 RepID=UPI000AF27491|nr:GyrI-like domain-containing protein [Vibrio mexicanus]